MYYKLDENKNVVETTLLEWSDFLENHHKERIVKQEIVNGKNISTIFLGLIHSYDESKLDIFETMVFDIYKGGRDIYCERHDTWQEAEDGHKRAIEWVKSGCKDIEDE
jgi:hypothetical protein